jgi:NAD(P)-dependent dehydrogenase (short-subunit alcohol dehydrogenase family)
MDLKLSEDGTVASKKDEWVVVLGGTGTVGQFAVQIAAACGYKVLASGSPARSDVGSYPNPCQGECLSYGMAGCDEQRRDQDFQQPGLSRRSAG